MATTNIPDPQSLRLAAQITEEQAQRLLADPELRAQCAESGVDLTLIISNWLVPVDERLRRNARAVQMLMEIDRAAREAGIKK